MKDKKILITGARGFVGKNLTATLLQNGYTNLYLFDREDSLETLDKYCTDCDFVFHLAGVNRPQSTSEFYEGNTDFSKTLLDTLKAKNNPCPVVVSSSIQALLDNDYGKSKKWAKTFSLQMALTLHTSCVFTACSANGQGQTTTQLWQHLCTMLHMVCLYR